MKKLKFVLITIAFILICLVIINETKVYEHWVPKMVHNEVGITGGTFLGAGFSKAELVNVADLVSAAKDGIKERDVIMFRVTFKFSTGNWVVDSDNNRSLITHICIDINNVVWYYADKTTNKWYREEELSRAT